MSDSWSGYKSVTTTPAQKIDVAAAAAAAAALSSLPAQQAGPHTSFSQHSQSSHYLP
jgi:hypothetical protein